MAELGLRFGRPRSALEAAALSRNALDMDLVFDAELSVHPIAADGVMLGAFQRGAGMPRDRALVRRGSGGPAVRVGDGTVHVLLALAEPSTLVRCEPNRLVNRYVRPLLRALTKLGASAHYFGRDWISVKHRPSAWVGFAHDATTQRSLFEALIAVRTPFALQERASFLGKAPGTVEAIVGEPLDLDKLVDAIVAAYLHAYGRQPSDLPPLRITELHHEDAALRADPPWRATVQEAIGEIGAGIDRRGALRLGGDLLISRDAITRVESRLAELSPSEGDSGIGRIVDEELTSPRVALDGVRSLANVRDVIARARSQAPS
jgi:hypothetical protein